MDDFTRSFLLLFVLLNPFIMTVYLLDMVRGLDRSQFSRQLARAGMISFIIYVLFAWAGDRVFENVLQVRFSSFLIFGGITFLIIGIRLILGISSPVSSPQPGTEKVSAAVALPFMVGPGTISASVLTGSRLHVAMAALVIGLALVVSLGAMVGLKVIHDYVRARNEPLVHRYTEIAGRVTALFTGSFAIEMIFTGLERWLEGLPGLIP